MTMTLLVLLLLVAWIMFHSMAEGGASSDALAEAHAAVSSLRGPRL